MLTQKMQETITRFKKNRKAATLTQEEALQKSRSNLLKPLVETLILSRLCRGDSYGYEIARSVEQGSGGQLRIPEGAMYPTLYRMMERGYHYRRIRGLSGGGGCAFIIRLRPPACAPQRAHGAYAEINAGYESCLAAMREPLPTQAEHS